MDNKKMNCDVVSGVCEIETNSKLERKPLENTSNTIELYYVSDPLCSHCWALEPILNRFIQQYGAYFHHQTIMGGLLEEWSGFSDEKNGINTPSDVAKHWEEVSEHARMPINGSIWLHDPVQSSYPASRVYKILQGMDEGVSLRYLRIVREAVMVFNKNIGTNHVLIECVNELGLDGAAIVAKANSSKGEILLKEDFALVADLGVQGFPTVVMINQQNQQASIVGQQSFQDYVNALKQLLPAKLVLPKPQPNLKTLLSLNKRLYSKEIELMYGIPLNQVVGFIKKELPDGSYRSDEILHEMYIELV